MTEFSIREPEPARLACPSAHEARATSLSSSGAGECTGTSSPPWLLVPTPFRNLPESEQEVLSIIAANAEGWDDYQSSD